MKWIPKVGHVGEEPPVGAACESFQVLQMQEGATICDPAMVTFVQFDGVWYHLCFEGDTAFWRGADPPAQPTNHDLKRATALVDLSDMEGIVGSCLLQLVYGSDEATVSLELRFDGGGAVVLRHSHDGDATSLEYRWIGRDIAAAGVMDGGVAAI